ncbi:MAG TPA: hypothetical protein VFT75_18305 [Nocardioidaceae bacterium]|nr:hypothetical protein [Nocardioidaceae bacterium]
MRSTTNWGLVVPDSDTDPDDVPTQVGDLADQLDTFLSVLSGTYANRPASTVASPGIVGRLYFVTGGGTNSGALYRDNGTGWDLLNGAAYGVGSTADVTTLGWGDTPSVGTAAKGWAAADHDHGTPANPVTAHVAATNPHPQYELAADMAIQLTRYTRQFLFGGM